MIVKNMSSAVVRGTECSPTMGMLSTYMRLGYLVIFVNGAYMCWQQISSAECEFTILMRPLVRPHQPSLRSVEWDILSVEECLVVG